MSKSTFMLVATLALGGALLAAHAARSRPAPLTDRSASAAPAYRSAAARPLPGTYARLPLSFEENRGQAPARYRYLCRRPEYSLLVAHDAAELRLRGSQNAPAADITMRVKGARDGTRVSGTDRLPGVVNYLIGRDRAAWKTGIPTFSRVRTDEVYPGIDLVFYGREGSLEYDFEIAPGADPNRIRLQFEGVRKAALDGEDLKLDTSVGPIRWQRPLSYQIVNGRRRQVASRYEIEADGEVGFGLGPYDRTRPLVIDPVLVYSTVFGGTNGAPTAAVAIDSVGAAYVAGWTASANFPLSNPMDYTLSGVDAFIFKLNPAGTELEYSTFLGGGGTDLAWGVAVDGTGAAYITGRTESADFPVTPGAFDRALAGEQDAYVVKISPDGKSMSYATLLGGSGQEQGHRIAVDGTSGVATVVGSTWSTDFPMTELAFDPITDGDEGFVARLNAGGSGLVFSSYFGGSGGESAEAVVLDPSGDIYVATVTGSPDLPVTPGGLPMNRGLNTTNTDYYVLRLSGDGRTVVAGTYIGSSERDYPPTMILTGLALAPAGGVYLCGAMGGTDFPTTAGAYQGPQGGTDIGIAHLNPDLTLQAATVIGTPAGELGAAIAADDYGVYVLGKVGPGLPAVNPVYQIVGAGNSEDAYVAHLDLSLSNLLFADYLGGSNYERPQDIAVDGNGTVVAVGWSRGGGFPTVNPFNPGFVPNGGNDGFVAKIDTRTIPPAPGQTTNLAGAAGLGVVDLSWTPTTGAIGYRIWRATSPAGPFTSLAIVRGPSSGRDDTVAPSTSYTYQVTGHHGGAEGPPSNSVTVTTPPSPGVPLAPSRLFAKGGVRSVELRWTQSTSTGVTRNRVYMSTAKGGPYNLVSDIPAATGTVVGTPYGIPLYFVVTAVNYYREESVFSNEASARARAF